MASMDEVLGSLDDQAKQKQQQDEKAAQSAEAAQNTDKIVGAVDKSTQATANALKSVKGEVKVINPTDMNGVVDSINKLNLTTFMQNEGLPKLAQNLSELSGKTQDLQDKLENEGLKKMSDQLGLVVKKLDEVSKTLSKTEVSVDAKLQKTIENLSKSINAIDFKPAVNVSAPQTKVVTTPVDLKPVLTALSGVEQAIKDSEAPETEIDLSAVTSGLSEVRNAITSLRFPVSNYVLPFRNSQGKATQVQLDASGNIPTSGGAGGGGGAATIADGADVAEGSTADAAYTSGNGTVVSVLKGIFTKLANALAVTQSGTWTVQPGNTANTTAWLVDETGRSVSSQTALTTVATVSGSAGRFAGGTFLNLNSVPSYIQVFDTTGAVTLGSTAPTFVQPVPANATPANGAAFVFNIHPGITMANGIKAAATTTATGASTSATALTGYFTYR